MVQAAVIQTLRQAKQVIKKMNLHGIEVADSPAAVALRHQLVDHAVASGGISAQAALLGEAADVAYGSALWRNKIDLRRKRPARR